MTSCVLVALRIKATPEQVFDAFTRDIHLWWRPDPLFAFTPRTPGVLAFEAGVGGRFTETLVDGRVYEIGRITVWDPGVRLAFSWRAATMAPGLATAVEVTFAPVGAETRVSVRHTGWCEIPPGNASRHGFPDDVTLAHVGALWRAELARLAQHFTLGE